MTHAYDPPTIDEWRRMKSAIRHRHFLERVLKLDEDDTAWLEAVERDDAEDERRNPMNVYQGPEIR